MKEKKKWKEEGAAATVDKCFCVCRSKHQQVCTHMQTVSPMCVLFMCFYVCSLVITRAGSAGALGDRKRRQTQFDVVEFSPTRE